MNQQRIRKVVTVPATIIVVAAGTASAHACLFFGIPC